MSQIPDAVHSYHPRPAEGGGTHVPFRISKRITATPPLITLFPPPPSPRNAPLGVRVALKTTYNLAVPSSLLPSLTTAAEQAQQAKTVVKHAQILRPESGRMCIRVKCVVDGVECVVPAVEDAFMAGLQRANEIIPDHPFLPSFAKDETKPTCFLERIDVELVFKTDRGTGKKKKHIGVGEASQQDPMMESQAGLDNMSTQSPLLLALNLASGLAKELRGAIDNVRDRFLIYGLAVLFPLIFKSRIIQRMRNDVRGIKSITESARTMFEHSRNRTFKREGGRLFNNLCQTLSKLTAVRQRALQAGDSGRDNDASQDGTSPAGVISSQRFQGNPGDFENVIGMSMMLLTLKVETGPRLKISATAHPPSTSSLETDTQDSSKLASSPERIFRAPLASSPRTNTQSNHEGQAIPFRPPRENLSYNHMSLLPSNMVRWDARAIQNLRSGRERTPSVIDSDEDFALDHNLPFGRRSPNNNIQEALSWHRTRMEYSPGLDSIISSDEDIRPRRRETLSFDGMGLTARSKRFSNDQQHLVATIPRQVASEFASDDIVSEGDSEMIQEEYANVAQSEESPQTPIQQNLMFRRQVYEDEHDQDVIDDETDTGSVYFNDSRHPISAGKTNEGPSRYLGRFPLETIPIARNSSMFSIVSSSDDDDDGKTSPRIAANDLRQINPPATVLPRSGDYLDRSTGHGLLGLSIADNSDVRATIFTQTQEGRYTARMGGNSKRRRARDSFGSIISDTSDMSGIIEDN